MDIIKFINSRDIAEHLKKINFKFPPLEAMYLIHKARNISLEEKHEAYKELIELYPDCVVEERRSDLKTQTLKEFLTELMIRQNLLIEDCKEEGDAAFYFSCYFSKDDEAWYDNYSVFSEVYPTYDRALKAAQDEDALKIRVSKKYIENNRHIELTLFPEGRVIDVDCYSSDPYIDYFKWMWVDIPTPFKRGDILTNIREQSWQYRQEQILVLDILDNWDSKKLAENGFRDGKTGNTDERSFEAWDRVRQHHREGGDVSDMVYSGYFYDNSPNLFCDNGWTYLDLEYYRGKLTGNKGVMTAMSNHLKGKVNGELLAKAYHIYALRDKLEDEELCLDNYTKETLELAGLKDMDK